MSGRRSKSIFLKYWNRHIREFNPAAIRLAFFAWLSVGSTSVLTDQALRSACICGICHPCSKPRLTLPSVLLLEILVRIPVQCLALPLELQQLVVQQLVVRRVYEAQGPSYAMFPSSRLLNISANAHITPVNSQFFLDSTETVQTLNYH